MQLNTAQSKALDIVSRGQNVFITGQGGVGKSELIKHIRTLYENRGVVIHVTALTGIAALNIKGSTLHRWAGIGLGDLKVEDLLKKVRRHPKGKANWLNTSVLVIDEVSMLSPELFVKLDFIGRSLRRCDEPFGGIQLIFCGDFCQLPPVKIDAYCFESPLWVVCNFQICYLTENMRQSDEVFQKILSEIRIGYASKEAREILRSRIGAQVGTEEIQPTKLFSNRDSVDQINIKALKALSKEDNPTQLFAAFDDITEGNYTDDQRQNFLGSLEKSCQARKELYLKVGAQVMLIFNLDPDAGLVNGSRGVVIAFESVNEQEKRPVVKFLNGLCRLIAHHVWEFEISDEVMLTRSQLPLILGFANTIHKCVAGSTLINSPDGLFHIEDFTQTNGWTPLEFEVHTMSGQAWTKAVYKGEIEPSIIIRSRMGFQLEGSHRHPILVISESGEEIWKTMPELDMGDTIVIRRGLMAGSKDPIEVTFKPEKLTGVMKDCRIPTVITAKLCNVIGMLIGDGCYSDKSDSYMIEYVSIDSELLEIFSSTFLQEFGITCGVYLCKREGLQNMTKLYANRKILRKFFLWCGLDYVTCRAKRIPWVVLQSSIECQIACLKGLFDTDGGCNATSIHYTSASRELCAQIQTMLCNLDILGRVTYLSNTDAWRVEITGENGRSFMKQISFNVAYKIEAGLKLYGDYDTDQERTKSNIGVIPGGAQLLKEIRELIGVKHGDSKRLPSYVPEKLRKMMRSIELGKHSLRCSQLSYIVTNLPDIHDCPAFTKLKSYVDNNWFFDTIISIFDGESQMYDFEVPDTHSFVSNCIISHNCQGLTIDCVEIDLGDTIFAPGQFYTALSRVRSLEGLSIIQINFDKLICDPKVRDFYQRLE